MSKQARVRIDTIVGTEGTVELQPGEQVLGLEQYDGITFVHIAQHIDWQVRTRAPRAPRAPRTSVAGVRP